MKSKIVAFVTAMTIGVGLAGSLVILMSAFSAHPVSSALIPAVAGTITGIVTRSDNGLPIGNLRVFVEDFNSSEWLTDTETNPNGVFTITNLATGDYRVGTCTECTGLNFVNEYYNNVFARTLANRVPVTDLQTTSGVNFALDPGGMIMGVVNDTDGNPVTTAWIKAHPATVGYPGGLATGQISSSGVYTLYGLPAGDYIVEGNAEGYEPVFYEEKFDWSIADLVPVTVGNVTSGINFTLRKERGGGVTGRVVLPNGDPVPYAGVSAESFNFMVYKQGGADENGDFRIGGLLTNTWRLRAYPPEDPAYRNYSESAEVLVVITPPLEITATVRLTLTVVNLVGRAVMPDGSGAAWAGVDVYNPDYSIHRGVGTDQGGFFGLGGLPVGNYELQLYLPWGATGVIPPPPTPFEIKDVNSILNLGNITFTQAVKHITGIVVRNDGTSVPNVDVNASLRGSNGWAGTQTGSSGGFILDVASGDWEVMINPLIHASGVDWVYHGAPKLVSFVSSLTEETKQITFTVETASATVSGKVVGPNGEVLQPWSGWVDVRNDEGQGNGAPLTYGGVFSIPVTAGTYHAWIGIDERLYPRWSSPQIAPFSVISGTNHNLGEIRLIEKTSAIQGRVTKDDGTTGVPGVWVHAWQHEGGWASTSTNSEGRYVLSVISGTWEINVEPPYTSTYVIGQPPQRVSLAGNETITGVNLTLLEAAAKIVGKLYDPDGNLLTDIDGWAYAREDRSPEPIAGAPVDRGSFELNVPSGTYKVGIWLPPNAGYTLVGEVEVGPLSKGAKVSLAQTTAQVAAFDMDDGERQVVVQNGNVITVSFTLQPNDARIVGTFYTDDAKTTPAVGLQGEVFAMGGIGGAWQAVPIDQATASFALEVAAGTWNLGYWLESSDYVNSPPPDTRVTIASTEVFTFNFTVVQADARIEGVILRPDAQPLNYAWAWAHRERTSTSATIDTGDEGKPPDARFSIGVPSGGQYQVGAHAPEEWGYIQPDFQVVTPTAGTAVSVTLKFKESNATITGAVYYHNEAGNLVYGPWAWVWAWSEDGQHTGAPTDANGNYRLNVVTGTTWHVGAAYQPEEGSLFYETKSDTIIVMSSNQASADLELRLAGTALPPAAAGTFDPAVGWTNTLGDGTRIEIPSGAMPTTDTVRISITPLVEELPNTLSARPFGFGYAIAAYEESTGNQIVSNFNGNVLITFYYTEDELSRRGVSEDDLSPAYFSTNTNSWTKVESYSVDKVANRLTVQINHFSTWVLTMPATAGEQTTTYLPIVWRSP